MKTPSAIIHEVTRFALEDWGMMLVEDVDTSLDSFELANELLLASLYYEGIVNGRISVIASDQFADSLCRNVLGSEPTIPVARAERLDALRELVNVVAGRFLTEAYGVEPVFVLSPPEAHPARPGELGDFFAAKVLGGLVADDEPFAVCLREDKRA